MGTGFLNLVENIDGYTFFQIPVYITISVFHLSLTCTRLGTVSHSWHLTVKYTRLQEILLSLLVINRDWYSKKLNQTIGIQVPVPLEQVRIQSTRKCL